MKKVKLSLIVALAILGASVTAFTGKQTKLTNTWYGQPSDMIPPYNTSYPIADGDLDTKCTIGSQHTCAVQLDGSGNLVATRLSSHNFRP